MQTLSPLAAILLLAGRLAAAAASSGGRKQVAECPALEARERAPTSVHDLRPDDIKVVMALGDSVMAGFGAKVFPLLETPLVQESRGLSFAMGGDPHAVTLPNLLRHYRGDVVGASRGTHLVELCHGALCPPDELAYRPAADGFNAAQTGATASNLGMEMKYLLRQVRHHPAVDVAADWKLLTLFLGSNDLCHYSCSPGGTPPHGSPDQFEARLWDVLERFRARIPRTLVVLMQLPDASQTHWFAHRHRRCLPAHLFLHMECPCAMGSEAGRWEMRLMTAEYNERIQRVASRINAAVAAAQPDRALQDFAVTLLPFMRDTDLKDDIPQHFLSKLDCFHPSNTAHKSMALAYWRSLFQAPAERSLKLAEETLVYCPTEDDRIATF